MRLNNSQIIDSGARFPEYREDMIYRKATLSSFHKSWKVVASCGERRLIAFLFSGTVCLLGVWIMMLKYLLGTYCHLGGRSPGIWM